MASDGKKKGKKKNSKGSKSKGSKGGSSKSKGKGSKGKKSKRKESKGKGKGKAKSKAKSRKRKTSSDYSSSVASAASVSSFPSISSSASYELDYEVRRVYNELGWKYGSPERFYRDYEFMDEMAEPIDSDNLIEYVAAGELSPDAFAEAYEAGSKPVIIRGLMDGWKTDKRWTKHALVEKYGDVEFGLGGGGTNVDPVAMTMKDYLAYCARTRDDNPFYLFEEDIGRRPVRSLLKDYEVPEYFKDDFFEVLPKEKRPPFRWFLIGPERSGSSPHQDPLGTSAWNALIAGRKRWVMMDPETAAATVFGGKRSGLADDEDAIHWFKRQLPKLKERGVPMIECIQEPGEVIFVPGGWWHTVLNLDLTIAVTQNFVSRSNFGRVWEEVCSDRPVLGKNWRRILRVTNPDLAAEADSASASPGSEGEYSSSISGWTSVFSELGVDRYSSSFASSSSRGPHSWYGGPHGGHRGGRRHRSRDYYYSASYGSYYY